MFFLLDYYYYYYYYFGVFLSIVLIMTKKGGSTASSPSTSFDNGPSSARFVCSMCAKVYRSGAGLRYHKRKRHRGKSSLFSINEIS